MKKNMKVWCLAVLCAASVFAAAVRMAPAAAEGPSVDEQQIRSLQTNLAAFVAAGDLDRVMKAYLPGKELFVFDSDLPRQHVGWESFKKDWGKFINSAEGVKYDVSDLSITVAGNAVFSHHLAHIVWTSRKDGSHHEQLMSLSDAYRKIDGKWLIAMEHFSVPVVNGKAVFVAWP